MNILIVDDDSVTRILMRAQLRLLGHTVHEAINGRDALETLARHPCRVVISDWLMPEMNGLDLCRQVRNRTEEYTYFILFSQQSASDENFAAASASGVDDFLLKPIVPRELRMRLLVAERILRYTQQVKQLESFLPICSYCRKVRNDSAYWQEIEAYFRSRPDIKLSHGICPDCYSQHVQPELDRMEGRQGASDAP